MRGLAEGMLVYSHPKSAGRVKSLVRSLTGGKLDSGKLSIAPPKEFDKQWERDGIQEKAPTGMGKREFWLIQVMERIPPSHWENLFQAPPGQLVMAAAADDFGIALLDAWSKAAQYFLCHEWMAALWDFWFQWEWDKARPKDGELAHARLMELLKTMQPADREPRALALLEQSEKEESMIFCRAAEDLPRPWSETLAQAFVAGTKRLMKTPSKNSAGLASWAAILECAARAIPPPCFAEALKPWDIPETDDYWVRVCRKAVSEFTESVRLRSDFHDAVSSKGL
jgi:hypothetical protein